MASERQCLAEIAASLQEVVRIAMGALNEANARLEALDEATRRINRAAARYAGAVEPSGMEQLKGTEIARVSEDDE